MVETRKRLVVCLMTTAQPSNDVRLFYRESVSLAKAGFEVHVVIPSEASGIREGVRVHATKRLRPRFLRMVLAPWIAAYRALRIRADIYHLHDPELLPVAFALRWLARKRVVFDVRESVRRQIFGKEWLPAWSRKAVSFLYGILERVCLKGCAIVVANDRSLEDFPKSYLVRNFPDVSDEMIRAAWPMEKRLQDPMLLYVGGVWETRGAIAYVELENWLRQRGHNCKLKIVGYYDPHFGEILRRKIRSYQLEDWIEIPGRLDYPECVDLMRQAVLGLAVLTPTPNYTFCLSGKILEYMMCGTPVLCSNFDHWRPYVNGAGMAVNPENIEEVCRTCEQMLQNREMLEEMGRKGMQAVRLRYNWASEFGELVRCYEELMGESLVSKRNSWLPGMRTSRK